MPSSVPRRPKHRAIFEVLQREIAAGAYPDGRLPGEVALTGRFAASRPTVARALDALRAQGLIERRPGAGTFLRRGAPAGGGVLGLIGAGLGHTEILGPIGDQLAHAAEGAGYRLVLGDAGLRERDAERLCAEYLARGVAGVFLAPLELAHGRELANRRLVAALRRARIPVVLLDRDLLDFPARSDVDLVAVDDVRAGCVLARHLLRGRRRRRLAVVARPGFPSTTDLRLAGCRQAAAMAGVPVEFLVGDPADPAFAARVAAAADSVACSNDATAVALIATLLGLGVAVPGTVRVGGFDNLAAAAAAPVALTSMRLPCRDLGRLALATLLERIRQPDLPPRQVLLAAELVQRRSSR